MSGVVLAGVVVTGVVVVGVVVTGVEIEAERVGYVYRRCGYIYRRRNIERGWRGAYGVVITRIHIR